MNAQDDPANSLAHERTDLAYHRNRWAAERTLMAWIRTSISMVTFGFAFDKFFAILRYDAPEPTSSDVSQRWFGLVLISAGILMLTLAVTEHIVILRRLKQREPLMSGSLSLPLFGASVVLLIGIGALMLILSRVP